MLRGDLFATASTGMGNEFQDSANRPVHRVSIMSKPMMLSGDCISTDGWDE